MSIDTDVMQLRTYALLIILCCLACTNTSEVKSEDVNARAKTEIKFDKTKWRVKNDRDYPYRDEMLDDLIYNVKLKGLKKDEVLNLLGQPDRSDSSYLFYSIAQKRVYFFPLHTKTLVLKLGENSTVV